MSTSRGFSVPAHDQLPATRQLVVATITAIVVAVALYYLAVLPAERGIDPTGVGRRIGLEDMGLWKVEIEKEMAEAAVFRAQRFAADSAAALKK